MRNASSQPVNPPTFEEQTGRGLLSEMLQKEFVPRPITSEPILQAVSPGPIMPAPRKSREEKRWVCCGICGRKECMGGRWEKKVVYEDE